MIKHFAHGHDLIKLIAVEWLKITRELDHQKHNWMELEKQLVAPIESAMQHFKDTVEQYNRKALWIRDHQQAKADQQQAPVESGEPSEADWLNLDVTLLPIPKGVRMQWDFEVIDPTQVPNGYWNIDEVVIKKAILEGIHDIPGVRIYEEAPTTFRR